MSVMCTFVVGLLFLFTGIQGQTAVRDLINCADCDVTPILGGGSYSSAKLVALWSLSYGLLEPKVEISYENTASGALTQLLTPCKKVFAYDYACQSYEIDTKAKANQDLVAFPFFVESFIMVYNIPGINNGTDIPINISRSVLSRIYLQDITRWDHPDITKLNTNSKFLPAATGLNITLVFRADATGATQSLLSALHRMDPANWSSADVGLIFPKARRLNNTPWVVARDQFSAVSFVLTTPGAIGYAPFNMADETGLKFASLQNTANKWVRPSSLSLKTPVDMVDFNDPNADHDPTDEAGDLSYPLAAVSWMIYHKTTADCDTYRAMFRFWRWCLKDPQAVALAHGLEGYEPLPPNALAHSLNLLESFQCDDEFILAYDYVDLQLSPLRQTMICISGILIMFTLSIFATLGYKRKSKITKAAGLAFAICFLFGCLLNYLAVFFWAISSQSNTLCQSRYSFVLLGYTLILGAMFSKSWEINKVFATGESGVANPFQEVPWWQFCRVFFSIVGIQVIILVIWILLDGPQSNVVIIDEIAYNAIHECTVQQPKVWIALESVFFSGLLIWGAYLAYETRDVWLKFNYPNESRSILLSIYNLAFCAIILVPLLTTLEVSFETLFFLASIAILWPTSFALFSVYFPKIAKFLGSSYRNSGHSKGDRMNPEKDRERSTTTSTAHSHVKQAERGQEQKLLEDQRRAKTPESTRAQAFTPTREKAAVSNGDLSPSSPSRMFHTHRGTDRTEFPETETRTEWGSMALISSPSLDDIQTSPLDTSV